MLLLFTGCTNTDKSYKYKMLVYGYSFGERKDSSSYSAEEGEYNSRGAILSQRKGDQFFRYAYDEKGNLISKTKYQYEDDWKDEYTEGQIIRKENFEYDELNRIKRRLVYSERGELIVTNNLSYFGDTIIIEDGFGTDLTDKFIYQSVSSLRDDSSVKFYSKNNYWKLSYIKGDIVLRDIISDDNVIVYSYYQNNKVKDKTVRLGFDMKEVNPSENNKLDWRNFKRLESEPKLMTPTIEESYILLTKPCEGRILESDHYEYSELDSLKLHIKDFGDTKIQIKYSYPDKFTEIREYSGSPYDSDNGKSVHLYDKFHRPKSIETYNVMGEPIQYKEYVYSK